MPFIDSEWLDPVDLRDGINGSFQGLILAHELEQPLSAFRMRAQLLLYRLEKRAISQRLIKRELTAMVTSCDEISDLITATKRLVSGSDPQFCTINLSSLVKQVAQRWRLYDGDDTICLEIEPRDLQLFVCGDRDQLGIVLMNALRNSSNALKKKGANDKRISIKLIKRQKVIEVEIADNGNGFQRGYDIQESTNQPLVGSRVGLRCMQAIMNGHKGELRVGNSTQMGGALLVLSLPSITFSPKTSIGKGSQFSQALNR